MNWCEKTDGELVAAFASYGAHEAFEELVGRHASMVFRTCRRITGSHQDAEDATQAVFATVIVKAHQLAFCTSLGGWLYSSAWHVSRRYRRAELTRQQRERRVQPVLPVDAAECPDGFVAEELYRAMEMLPEEYRDAVVLHHLEGWTVTQVATLQNCSAGTVASRLSRARAMMRERLSWRGVVMTDAAITTFVIADLTRYGATSSAAKKTAAAALSSATIALPEIATMAVATASGFTATQAAAGGTAAATLLGGISATKWAAALAISLGIAGTAATVASTTPTTQQTRRSESAASTTTTRQSATATVTRDRSDAGGIWYVASSSAVPEPTGVAALGVAGLILARRRRH